MFDLCGRDDQRRRQAQRRLAPAVPTSSPRSGTRRRRPPPGGRARRRAAARAAHLADVRQRAASRREPCADSRDRCEQLVVNLSQTATRRRARDGVAAERAAWSPGTNPSGASSATSRQPIGSPFARPLASITRVGPDAELLEGEERARPADSRLHFVESRAARRLVGERARGCDEPRVEQMTPPSPCTGSSRMQPVSSVTAASSDADVVRERERDAGQQRLERLALRRLAGDGERAHRAAVERALERDDARLARSPCARTSAPPRSPPRRSCRRTTARRRTAAESRSASSSIGSVQ